MNVNLFKTNFLGDVTRPNMFAAVITRPRGMSNLVTSITQPSARLSLLCMAGELPGKALQTAEYRDYGPARKLATGAHYEDVTLQFIVPDDMLPRQYFHDWMNYISENENSGGFAGFGGVPPNHDVEYYNNYVSNIHLTQLTSESFPSLVLTLEDAYPIAMSSLPVSWESQNEFHRLSVTFNYYRLKTKHAGPVLAGKGLLGGNQNITGAIVSKFKF